MERPNPSREAKFSGFITNGDAGKVGNINFVCSAERDDLIHTYIQVYTCSATVHAPTEVTSLQAESEDVQKGTWAKLISCTVLFVVVSHI